MVINKCLLNTCLILSSDLPTAKEYKKIQTLKWTYNLVSKDVKTIKYISYMMKALENRGPQDSRYVSAQLWLLGLLPSGKTDLWPSFSLSVSETAFQNIFLQAIVSLEWDNGGTIL